MIHAHYEAFDERNPFLLCVVGLASVAGGLGALVGPATSGAAAAAPAPDDPDDRLAALLGAASLALALGEALRREVGLLGTAEPPAVRPDRLRRLHA